MNKVKYLIGEVYKTKRCGTCTVIGYTDNGKERLVEFEPCAPFWTPYRVVCNVSNLGRGNVTNIYHPTIKGVACIGRHSVFNKNRRCYRRWMALLDRCYGKDVKDHYKGTTVCAEWLIYVNFEKWFEENFKEGWDIDKDLFGEGDKVYSPETCRFVPRELNNLITKTSLNSTNYSKTEKGYSLYLGDKRKYINDNKLSSDITNIAIEQYNKHMTEKLLSIKDKYDLGEDIIEKAFFKLFRGEIVGIVAHGKDYAIGQNKNLLWNLPKDLRYFKEVSTGNVNICGYNTYPQVKNLEGRDFIVPTRKGICKGFLEVVKEKGCSKLVVIGGEATYKRFEDYLDVWHITTVNKSYPEADTFFTPDLSNFEKVGEPVDVSSEDLEASVQVWKRVEYVSNH